MELPFVSASRAERALISTPHVSPLGHIMQLEARKHWDRCASAWPPSACTHTPPPEEAGGMACITNRHHRQSCNKRRAGRSLNLKRSILHRASRPLSQPSPQNPVATQSEMQSPLIYCDCICLTLLQAVMIVCTLLYCAPSELLLQEPAKPATISALQRPLAKRRLFPLTE